MMGEAGKLDVHRRTVSPTRQRDPQNLRSDNGIIAERLIEVPHTEEEQGIRVLAFKLQILLHQGGLSYFLGHGDRGKGEQSG